jgi:hypothetical protein
MKKSIFVVSALAVASSSVFAAPAYSGIIGTDKFTAADCPAHLDADPSIQRSSGVIMAFNCINGSPAVALTSCHTAGLVKSRSQKVVCDDDIINGVTPLIPACDGTDPNTPSGAASGFNYITTTGASIWGAQTGGGSLGALSVADGTKCDTAGASAKTAVDTF